ncbi:MAG: DoxX family protein [Gemmatimonadetes bacterium]|nr:DoxX family protein [Gemmatimonadota bacterium]
MKQLIQQADAAAARLAPYAAVLLRLAVGGVFLKHGIDKVGMGLAAVSGFFGQLGIPFATLSASVVITVETLGAACVILGLLTRFWAACFVIDMIVAIAVAVLPTGRNAELELLLLAGALALIGLGDGPLSVRRATKR